MCPEMNSVWLPKQPQEIVRPRRRLIVTTTPNVSTATAATVIATSSSHPVKKANARPASVTRIVAAATVSTAACEGSTLYPATVRTKAPGRRSFSAKDVRKTAPSASCNV